ncbi:HNH endonuclease [Desulfosporosinus nitroreducens]|uniref:HNH endonuclease n=1 Tax=Desulfosporosinus nitroreducens TaxID=2018668 RepID=A0ABT8QZL6_9FIRM|nr:HNH endonuclease [Desulfosporosinus nitroreducens]MDO0826080.1 HNH endonuclease [Desulfosporosinus nitroreducens]
MTRDNNECQRCKGEGNLHVAECVHHKKHLRKHPELALAGSNLISLCLAFHDIEHSLLF